MYCLYHKLKYGIALSKFSNSNIISFLFYFLLYSYKYNILICFSGKFKIVNRGRMIQYGGSVLNLGTETSGFTINKDNIYLNNKGLFYQKGLFVIGKGCRFSIGPKGKLILGENSSIGPNSVVIIEHELAIGPNTIISWNCQILDEDYHKLIYKDKKQQDRSNISIGSHVWIGNHVSIQKGVKIPDGCVVAAHSVVKGVFEETNVLLAGNSARIIKRNIAWQN